MLFTLRRLILGLSDVAYVLESHGEDIVRFLCIIFIQIFAKKAYRKNQFKYFPKKLLLDLGWRCLLELQFVATVQDFLCLFRQNSEKTFSIKISADEKRFHLKKYFIKNLLFIYISRFQIWDRPYLNVKLFRTHDNKEG